MGHQGYMNDDPTDTALSKGVITRQRAPNRFPNRMRNRWRAGRRFPFYPRRQGQQRVLGMGNQQYGQNAKNFPQRVPNRFIKEWTNLGVGFRQRLRSGRGRRHNNKLANNEEMLADSGKIENHEAFTTTPPIFSAHLYDDVAIHFGKVEHPSSFTFCTLVVQPRFSMQY